MFGDEFRHLKHVDRRLAAEHFFEIFVGVDVPLVCRVLKVVLFDVFPELFYDLRPGHRPLPDYRRQFAADVQWLHKSRVGFCHAFIIPNPARASNASCGRCFV